MKPTKADRVDTIALVIDAIIGPRNQDEAAAKEFAKKWVTEPEDIQGWVATLSPIIARHMTPEREEHFKIAVYAASAKVTLKKERERARRERGVREQMEDVCRIAKRNGHREGCGHDQCDCAYYSACAALAAAEALDGKYAEQCDCGDIAGNHTVKDHLP